EPQLQPRPLRPHAGRSRESALPKHKPVTYRTMNSASSTGVSLNVDCAVGTSNPHHFAVGPGPSALAQWLTSGGSSRMRRIGFPCTAPLECRDCSSAELWLCASRIAVHFCSISFLDCELDIVMAGQPI